MHHSTSQGPPSSSQAKDKGKIVIGLEEQVEDKHPSPSLVQKDLVDLVAASIGKDREYLLEKVNEHLDNLLRRAYKATNLQRHTARHYYTRNCICKIRVRKMKRRLKKTLIKLKNRDKLDFLDDASLIV